MPDKTCPVTTDVARAAEILNAGGLVAFGTETVYGLGANALDENAVARVFEAKNRPHFDPLIVHIASDDWLEQLVESVSPIARQLADAFWPGPLTMVLPKKSAVPDLVTAGLPTVAIRIPDHPLALKLLATADLPVAAPSANPFGQISPTTAQHVLDHLGHRIDLVLDGGACAVGVESTVILVTDERPRILRHGGITQEQIEAVIGPVDQADSTQQNDSSQQDNPDSQPAAVSPGMLSQHYSPATPLFLINDVTRESLADKRVGLLRYRPHAPSEPSDVNFAAIEILTEDGELRTAATGFFAALRRLDAEGLDLILAEPFPDEGLGRALNDRLTRACHR